MPKCVSAIGYSDGSCLMKGAGFHPGGWGATLKCTFDDGSTFIYNAYDGKDKTTNNEMEMTGLLKLLRLLPRGDTASHLKATLNCDSEYVLKTLVNGGNGELKKRNLGKGVEFTGYLAKWIPNGWTKADGGEVKNLELWKTIVREVEDVVNSGITLELKWVKGHAGHKGNEIADTLANLGSSKAKNGGNVSPEYIISKIERYI